MTRASYQPQPIRHPLGVRARVLLSSVFGPYARDDEYRSRRISPMEGNELHPRVILGISPYDKRLIQLLT